MRGRGGGEVCWCRDGVPEGLEWGMTTPKHALQDIEEVLRDRGL